MKELTAVINRYKMKSFVGNHDADDSARNFVSHYEMFDEKPKFWSDEYDALDIIIDQFGLTFVVYDQDYNETTYNVAIKRLGSKPVERCLRILDSVKVLTLDLIKTLAS